MGKMLPLKWLFFVINGFFLTGKVSFGAPKVNEDFILNQKSIFCTRTGKTGQCIVLDEEMLFTYTVSRITDDWVYVDMQVENYFDDDEDYDDEDDDWEESIVIEAKYNRHNAFLHEIKVKDFFQMEFNNEPLSINTEISSKTKLVE